MTMPSELPGTGLDMGRLEAWLGTHLAGFHPPFVLSKFPGGQSNPTYLIDAASGKYVLRRKPFGDLLPSAHAVDREFRLISALSPAGFRTAKPLAFCEDPTVIGSLFYVMSYLDGRTFWDGALPQLNRVDRSDVYFALVDTLADLHGLDPVAVGLSDYGKPGNYFERQVGLWTRQYRASQTDQIDSVENLMEWLPRTVPPQTRTSIVHGDYRIDNVVFASDRTQVLGVLDWELSTLGDPLADFTYFAMSWIQAYEGKAGLQGLDLPALGIPSIDAMIERYCVRTGRDGLPDLDWYFAYNLFRITAILQGVKKRALQGNASSADAADMAGRIVPFAERAWQFARKSQKT
ncbi:phosphotransferase family protein [Asticcacaulis sp. AC402]|uniref:phosphotransferase family protein n=1 Tax=Asticcacaulis sp. AC402 TaxID=1282361 RepID=UPI0003C40D4F|nr:phosphotransferase family protein [Asticcacaulis sp. AC402]ESQ73613.1 hypothetical protein ABAC402_18490 [Asticcacaulis sp. AC402]